MNRFTRPMAIGSICALGLALTPVLAQPDEHGGAHGNQEHAAVLAANAAALPSCPLTGEPINLAVSTATDDGPVFFCCQGCIAKYKASPAKYRTKVAAQRTALAKLPKIQVTCPVSGEPVDQDVFLDGNGQKVYFCCEQCRSKYERNSKKYASALANSYTYQTKCPVTNEEIDPTAFTTIANGMNVYFCCKGCDKKFLKSPQKYVPNLIAEGFTIDPKELTRAADHHDHGDHDHHGH